MKKIINRKMYDTETAKCVGSFSYGSCRDFDHYAEELYRKKTGEYFLYGEGGAASKYARGVDQNSTSGGWEITPLSEERAMDWAEKYLDADEYEAIFGKVEE